VKNNELKEMMDAFQERCRKAGLKVTPQRMAIYSVLIGTKEHPSAEMVFRKVRKVFPNISLDTVNRTLITLSEIGIAFIVEGSGDAKRYDGNLDNHQHFKCIKCKRVIDFYHKSFDNIKIPKSIDGKFTILRRAIYFEGICDLCGKKVDNRSLKGAYK
jgi:Fur family peroxide stress response transcriptional regulator